MWWLPSKGSVGFGLDFAVLGQQGLASVHRGGAQIILGLINEAVGGMHSPLLRAAYSGAEFDRRMVFMLDGVEQLCSALQTARSKS